MIMLICETLNYVEDIFQTHGTKDNIDYALLLRFYGLRNDFKEFIGY
jgi:outer membrane protein assembly factor BamD (BamD/ComL family)